MGCYFAPMEGITNYIYRNAHSKYFMPTDKYFTPFISPDRNHVFSEKGFKDVLPEKNKVKNLVPQLLTRSAEDFIWAAGELKVMGYEEVNLNLGCPSGTVVAKGKGSGFLKDAQELDRFFEEVFSHIDIKLSVKSRLGIHEPEEFPAILAVFNKYPISELILHPRVQKDLYRLPVRTEDFAQALKESRNPLVWNGDLNTTEDVSSIRHRFPEINTVMIGRGLVRDPALAGLLNGEKGVDKERLRSFHDEIYEECAQAFSSRRNAMLRMKELWWYMADLFEESEGHIKRIKKAADTRDFELAVESVFRDLELKK